MCSGLVCLDVSVDFVVARSFLPKFIIIIWFSNSFGSNFCRFAPAVVGGLALLALFYPPSCRFSSFRSFSGPVVSAYNLSHFMQAEVIRGSS